jgi:hypothetical protein
MVRMAHVIRQLRASASARVWFLVALAFALSCAPRSRADAPPPPITAGALQVPGVAPESAFAHLVAQLSEPGGFFDSDNLISNETSYLHVLDAMRRLGVHGGAYVGVGPDQNFSYIAAVRPNIAFMFDIRRDNMLQHLLFKSLFAMSRNRAEYVALLFGKPVPADVDAWRDKSIQELVNYLDATPAREDLVSATRGAILSRVARFGIALSPTEVETIDHIRGAFVRDSLSIRYSSLGRSPRPYHPTYRQLLLERDRAGTQANYLASEEAFQFVKAMEERNLIVPVVGNAAGDKALIAVGRYIAERGEKISVLYMSNVEQYLMRDGTFPKFVENVKLLPRDDRSVMIRSYFGFGYGYGYGGAHPLNVTGHFSTQILERLDSFAAAYDSGTVRSYYDLVSRNYVEP